MPKGRLILKVELERERQSRRWLADCVSIPGVMVYGSSAADAFRKAQALAFDVIADRVRHGEDLLTGKKLARVGTALRTVEFERARQTAVAGY
jgi:predicted RNase H-like HicB family nuclease